MAYCHPDPINEAAENWAWYKMLFSFMKCWYRYQKKRAMYDEIQLCLCGTQAVPASFWYRWRYFLSPSTHNPDTACILWAENKWDYVDCHSHAIWDALRELSGALEAAPEGPGYPICPGSDLLTVRPCLKYPTAFQKIVCTYLCLCGRIVPRTLIEQCTHGLRLAFQSRLRKTIWEQPLSFFLPARRSWEQNFPQ